MATYTTQLVLCGGIADERTTTSAGTALLAAAAKTAELERVDPANNQRAVVLVTTDDRVVVALERRGSRWVALTADDVAMVRARLAAADDPNADSRLTARDLGLDRYAR